MFSIETLTAALHTAAARQDYAATRQILAELERQLPIDQVVELCAQLPLPAGVTVPPPPWQAGRR